MRLLVYEHVSGGGFADELITASVLSEGFAMLRTLISDFKAAGHKVTTTLDSRIARLNPPIAADCIMPVSSSDQTQVTVQKIAESVDAAYVIAPETDGALQSFVKLVEKTGVASLNCTSAGIEKVSEKIVFHKFMKNLGMPLPETKFFSIADDLQEIKKAIRSDLNFPVIFKPADGVSCIGLSVVRNEEQVAGAINKINRSSLNKHFLIQELIKGTASSVSLLSSGSTAVSISLNRQDVTIGTPDTFSSYSGGVAPFEHPLQNKTFEVAEKLVKAVPELRGYIGIDFVLSENGLVAIEINPRLTTSYVGLRRIVNFNPAQAIVNAVLKAKLPTPVESSGFAVFSKVDTFNPTHDVFQRTCRMDEVVSPPFPVSESGIASALIASHATTLYEASTRLRETKKRVLNNMKRGN